MPPPNESRTRRRRRIELAIRIAGPLLDLLLFAGDRVGRALEPDDADYVPARMAREGESAPRGLRAFHARRAPR
jgi:hypothetical protein